MGKRVYTKAYASLRILGDALDPMVVTAALRLPPDIAHRKGEHRFHRTRGGKVVESGIPWWIGHWSMSSEKYVGSPRLEVHVAWILAEVEPKSAVLRDLLDQGFIVDIFCFSSGSTALPPAVPRSLRDRASAIGLTIGIDHYDTTKWGME